MKKLDQILDQHLFRDRDDIPRHHVFGRDMAEISLFSQDEGAGLGLATVLAGTPLYFIWQRFGDTRNF